MPQSEEARPAELRSCIDAVESRIDDPHRGLPEEVFLFVTRLTPMVNVDLLIRDTSGDTGLPPLLGWAGMLPSLAGLVAVALLWSKS